MGMSEWAVVNRLKTMLDVPPKTKFKVTQSFALFSAMLLWTKQRASVPDHALFQPADRAARAVTNALEASSISIRLGWSQGVCLR
jgi:hypothetical protein